MKYDLNWLECSIECSNCESLDFILSLEITLYNLPELEEKRNIQEPHKNTSTQIQTVLFLTTKKS